MKTTYETPVTEIIYFETEDVIITSSSSSEIVSGDIEEGEGEF